MTAWHYEDECCWVADCDACRAPMVVWREHGASPPADALDQMIGVLETAAGAIYGEGGFVVDRVMRQIPGHFHAHARPRAAT